MAGKQTRAFWEQHIAAWEASGSTQAGYCRRHGLKYWTFKDWRQRLRPVTTSTTASHQALVPVMVSAAQPVTGTLELCVGDQVRLSLPLSADAAWLGALLRSAAAC